MKHRLVRLSMVVGAVFAGMFLLQAIFIPYVQKLDGKPPVPELPTEPRALGDYYFSGLVRNLERNCVLESSQKQ